MAHVVPKVKLDDLTPLPSGMASPAFATAAEKLAVGLSKNRVVVVALPRGQGATLMNALVALLGPGTLSLPGCDVREWRAGGAYISADVEQAYGAMESTARLVLSALARSNVLRLRGDAFTPTLDDLPLSRSSQGSSCLAAKAFVDNFSSLSAAATTAEEASERGLLNIFFAMEAPHPDGGARSAWQVQDSSGSWRSVTLEADEVAVTLGHTMQHACAGLLQPGSHRVVGEPYGIRSSCAPNPHTAAAAGSGAAGSGKAAASMRLGRAELHFELRPRPSAVLDLRPQLEAAGHTVPARFNPVSVSCLMEQFECLLSPAKLATCTPDQQQGAAAHKAWAELQASLKRSKKRVGTLNLEASSDKPHNQGGRVTRSGNLRRSTEGANNQQQQQQQMRRSGSRQKLLEQQAAAAAGTAVQPARVAAVRIKTEVENTVPPPPPALAAPPLPHSLLDAAAAAAERRRSSGRGRPSCFFPPPERRRDSLEPASTALYIVRGKRCTVLDGCLQDSDPADCLTICVRSFTGLERWFYCSSTLRCGAIFEMFCARLGISLGAVKFMLRGERVFGASSPASLKMEDGEELTAVPNSNSSDRLQQARELGPLFATVFGKDASAAAQEDGLPPI
ncbi:Ubiquitin-like protein pmt3/smt3 [Chlorella vulgaris]